MGHGKEKSENQHTHTQKIRVKNQGQACDSAFFRQFDKIADYCKKAPGSMSRVVFIK
jgi:hypothetical protein